MKTKRKFFTKSIVVAIALLLIVALGFGLTGAWYRARRGATGTMKFDKGIVIQYSGFDNEITPAEDWAPNANAVRLFTSESMLPGSTVAFDDAQINQKSGTTPFFARVKLVFDFYSEADNENSLISPASLETANFKVSDLLTEGADHIFTSVWTESGDGWFYYTGAGETITQFPTSATDIFVTTGVGAQYIIAGDTFGPATPANYQEGGAFHVANSEISIAQFKITLIIDTLQADATPADCGWVISEIVTVSNLSKPLNVKTTSFEDVNSLTDGSSYYFVDNSNKGFSFTYTENSNSGLSSNGSGNVSTLSVKTLSQTEAGTATITGIVGSPTAIVFPETIDLGNDSYLTVDAISISTPNNTVTTVVSDIDVSGSALLTAFPNVTSIYVNTNSNVTNASSLTEGDEVALSGIAGETYTSYTIHILTPAEMSAEYLSRHYLCISNTPGDISQTADSLPAKNEDELDIWYHLVDKTTSASLIFSVNGTGLKVEGYDFLAGYSDWSDYFDYEELSLQLNGDGFELEIPKYLVLGDNVYTFTNIGASAFDEGEWISNIIIPDSITTIETAAFRYVHAESLVIPSSVTSLDEGAFEGCKLLTSVFIDSTTIAADNDDVDVWSYLFQNPYNSENGTTSVRSIYVKQGLTVGKRILHYCDQAESSDVAGYNKYVVKEAYNAS